MIARKWHGMSQTPIYAPTPNHNNITLPQNQTLTQDTLWQSWTFEAGEDGVDSHPKVSTDTHALTVTLHHGNNGSCSVGVVNWLQCPFSH